MGISWLITKPKLDDHRSPSNCGCLHSIGQNLTVWGETPQGKNASLQKVVSELLNIPHKLSTTRPGSDLALVLVAAKAVVGESCLEIRRAV